MWCNLTRIPAIIVNSVHKSYLPPHTCEIIATTATYTPANTLVDPNLVTKVLPRGHAICKAECANHAIKCYRSALEKFAQENAHYRGKGQLTKNMQK